LFVSCIIHILYTGCAKTKKIISKLANYGPQNSHGYNFAATINLQTPNVNYI